MFSIVWAIRIEVTVMAQTTHLAPFGPVYVAVAFAVPPRPFKGSKLSVFISWYKKAQKKEE